MKKNVIQVAILSAFVTLYACKGHKTTSDQTNTTSTETTTAQTTTETKPATTSEPATKGFAIKATPDTASLGKNLEAFIKIKNLKAIELSNPNGDVTGTELTYDLEVTNKNSIGGGTVYVNPDNFRLELDNGTKISHDTYNTVSVQADATGSSVDNKFKLPAGTKPKALDLFFNETKAVVKLDLN